jgi:hypothetical protein
MHGDERSAAHGCQCTICAQTRKFMEFRDLDDAFAPQRPTEVNTRRDAAAAFRWVAYQIVQTVEAEAQNDVVHKLESDA